MKLRSVTAGRAALVVSVVAMVAALTGTSLALPGSNKVDRNDLKRGVVATKNLKNQAVSAPKMRVAYVHIDGAGTLVPGDSKNVIAINKPVPNVFCLNLKFVPVAGTANRTIDSGGGTATEIGVGPTLSSALCPAGFRDAVFQGNNGNTDKGYYAVFF
jgi:hypothetical protein